MTEDLPQLPFPRDGVLDVAPLYERLRAQAPVTRVRTPAGDPAWIVTRYDAARALFADPRLGRTHPAPETAARISDSPVMGGPVGEHATERADHARWRGLMTPSFTARRMAALAERVQQIVDALIDGMVAEHERTGGPVDLHEHVAVALPVTVIGELVGVPHEDRRLFRDLSLRATDLHGGDDPMVAMGELFAYGVRLTAAKRAEPGEDLVSDLATREDAPSDDEIAAVVAGLLFAGHETTLTRIDLGTILLLEHPRVADRLRAEPGHVDAVVEEVLRLTAPGQLGMLRYAHTDVEVPAGEDDGDDVVIGAGDAVVLSLGAANHDPRAFPDPDTFDPDRPAHPHVAFGHGPHFCVGAALARTELRVALSTLVTRLPGLRLAADTADLRVLADRFTGGISELPVTW